MLTRSNWKHASRQAQGSAPMIFAMAKARRTLIHNLRACSAKAAARALSNAPK